MTQKKETPPAVKEFLERVRARRPALQKVELESFGAFYLRLPTGADQVKITGLKQALQKQGLESLPQSAFAAVMGAVLMLQEDGAPFFEDPEAGYHELSQMNAKDLDDLYVKVTEICTPMLTAKAVEDAEKKSSSDQNSPPGTN